MPAVSYSIGRRQHVEELFVPRSQDREPFVLGESLPFEHPTCKFLPAAGGTGRLDQSAFDDVFHEWFLP